MDLNPENSNNPLQDDEIEALSSIYGEDWVLEDLNGKVYSINITSSSGKSVYFQVILPKTYPLQSPPIYRISAPWMNRDAKSCLSSALDEIYFENIGESIIYQWIVRVQDFIDGPDVSQTPKSFDDSVLEESLLSTEVMAPVEENNNFSDKSSGSWDDEIPPIQHGETIVDRKSVFQAHIAEVVSVKQVKQVLQKLKENKKIFMATHNIFAYRMALENDAFVQDCEDDGESKAGSVLLHLLQVLDVSNVLVVVSRWYGGIHLGADRFKHISNAARSLLSDCGYIKKKDNRTPKKGKKITS